MKSHVSVGLAAVAQHGIDVDLFTLESNRLFCILAGVDHRERDLGSLVAFESLDRVVERHAVGRLAVDFDDAVAGQQTRPVGGRAIHRAKDVQPAAVGGDLDSDAAELALDAGAEAAQLLGRNVARIGIQLGQHAANGRLDQLAAIHLGDVVPLDLVDRVDQFLVELVVAVLGEARRRCWRLGRGAAVPGCAA